MKYSLQRRELIQGLRGIAIILVVAHHAISNFSSVGLWNKFVKFIDMFYVNIFFFIAGYLFMNYREKYERQGFGRFIIRKIKSIFIPYYVSTFLFSLCVKVGTAIPRLANILQQKGYFEKSVLNMMFDPFLFHKPYFMSLWFVYVLFIYFFIAWFHSKCKITTLSVAIITLVSMLINSFLYNYYPDIVYKFIRYYPYFLFGMMLNMKTKEELHIDNKKVAIAFIVFLLIAGRVFAGDISFMQRHVRAVYMQCEWLICAISGLIVLATIIERTLHEKKEKALIYIGNKSYSIYLIHNSWIIVPVSVITVSFSNNTMINIAINFTFGMVTPIVLENLYIKLLSWRQNSVNQSKKRY